jgi:hypothetical protein
MLIHDSETWRLESWGHGLSYAFTHKPTNRQYFCQGDDALDFERQLDAIEEYQPGWSYDRCLAWAWDQCDFSSVATPA